jgi:hypothetical protein
MRITYKVDRKGKDHTSWLSGLSKGEYLDVLDRCGQKGVEALKAGTPVKTGLTAASWSYEVVKSRSHATIIWSNSNVTRDGHPIAIMLQMGHGTGTGGYVVGRDYINPAMKPVFDEIENEVWKAVTRV